MVLLCLPGSMVPGTGIFSIPHLDKLVHIFLFGAHVLFWGWHYGQLGFSKKKFREIIIADVILTIGLGVGLEYVQKYWIPNRTFDGMDILADLTGAIIAGLWLMFRLRSATTLK